MGTAVINPYEFTATGILGDKRKTMLANQLLLRVSMNFTSNYKTVNFYFTFFWYANFNYDVSSIEFKLEKVI